MNEYTIEAVVLAKDASGEADSALHLFSREYGKIPVKTKSSRKLLSKINGHTQPGAIIVGRVVEKNTALLVDALQIGFLAVSPLILLQLTRLLPEAVAEPDVWNVLIDSPRFMGWKDILKTLGWGHETATCATCSGVAPSFFHIPSQEFYCQNCTLNTSVVPSDLLLC